MHKQLIIVHKRSINQGELAWQKYAATKGTMVS